MLWLLSLELGENLLESNPGFIRIKQTDCIALKLNGKLSHDSFHLKPGENEPRTLLDGSPFLIDATLFSLVYGLEVRLD